jgi:hypothetical protein
LNPAHPISPGDDRDDGKEGVTSSYSFKQLNVDSRRRGNVHDDSLGLYFGRPRLHILELGRGHWPDIGITPNKALKPPAQGAITRDDEQPIFFVHKREEGEQRPPHAATSCLSFLSLVPLSSSVWPSYPRIPLFRKPFSLTPF